MSLANVKNAQLGLKRAEAKQKTARAKLQLRVKQARKQHTLHEIGQALGMTRQGVYDLLKR